MEEEKAVELWSWLVEDGNAENWAFPIEDQNLVSDALSVVRTNPPDSLTIAKMDGEEVVSTSLDVDLKKPHGEMAVLLCPHWVDSNWRAFFVIDTRVLAAIGEYLNSRRWDKAFYGKLVSHSLAATRAEILAVLDHAKTKMRGNPSGGAPEVAATSSHPQSEVESAES